MERNREARRLAATNGLSRRRQRASSLRDSPEEDGVMEMQETSRLRDRGNKKDRDRERLSRNKRRRAERFMHGSNREEGDDSTEESVEDDEEDDDEESGSMRMLPPNPSSSVSLSSHHHHHQRRSFPPAKVIRAAPPPLRGADEMIGVSVPRKARTASAKRSHDYWVSGGGGGGGGSGGGGNGEPMYRQASISPARPSMAAPSPAPISPPSSSNVSAKKKTKLLGPNKQKPPKMAKPSSSSSNQDEIEIEVAEVLYGLMRQSQCPSKQEIVSNASPKRDLKDTNGSTTDAKSRVSSPVSNSSTLPPPNSSSSTNPLPSMVPKRKKPRPLKVDEEIPTNLASRNGSSSSASKIESENSGKVEISSPKLKKNVGSAIENGGVLFSSGNSQELAISTEPQTESAKPESNTQSYPKPSVEESRNGVTMEIKKDVSLPKNDSPPAKVDDDLEDALSTKPASTTSEVQSKREEKFQIDLMAPPPLKSSPDRDGVTDFVQDSQALVPEIKTAEKMEEVIMKDEEKTEKSSKQHVEEVVLVEKKKETAVEEFGMQSLNKGRILDLQLNLEKQDQENGSSGLNCSKQQQEVQKQQPHQQSKSARDEPKIEKSAAYTSMPVPMTLAAWPGGIPPIGLTGQVPALQGVVSMDGSVVPSSAMQPPNFLFSQPRLKRCAQHYYIARTIYNHQQFSRINPYWHAAAAGSASLYGSKPYNLNIVPPTEAAIMGNPLPGVFPPRNLNLQDLGQAAALQSGHIGKDKSSVSANYVDGGQRKQLVLQQAAQPAATGNVLPPPAFIFPISQQQPVVAATSRSGAVKSATASSNAASSSASNFAQGGQAKNSLASAGTTNMSFSYQNLPPNEAQYMAVLQNSGYPFHIPSHVGAQPQFRSGTHPQAMSFYNGSFYPSPLLHPSQIQQQQLQQQSHSQSQPVQQGHQNASTSSGSSSSQKHQQNQQQRVRCDGNNGAGAGSSQSFHASKSRPQQQSSQNQQNQHLPHHARQIETEMGGEDSSVTSDSRVSHVHKGVYNQNFALPMHPQSALISATALAGGSGNHGEKQQQQHQSLKAGMELLPPQSIALSFAPFNGPAPPSAIDMHALLQSLPEAARQQYQFAAVAAVAQQKKTHQMPEDGKTVSESSNTDEERKALVGKGHTNFGQSLVFSRPDSNDQSTPMLGNSAVESSSRTLNPNRSRPTTSAATATAATASGSLPSSVFMQQQQQHQQQLLLHLHKQQQQQHQQKQLGKLSNPLPGFPQAVVQSSNPSQSQSPQWKSSAGRTTSSTPSMATSSLKNHSQQQSRTQHGNSQISFGVNSKSATASHGQQLPASNQSPSPPMAVGSPTHSISRSAGGSPRTTSTGSKVGPTPTLSSQQQAKNSQSGPSRKSSPAGGRSVPSILGSSHVSSTPSSGTKPQTQQQQQQQHQFQKQVMQHAQFYFTNAFMQAQSPQSTNAPTNSSGIIYYNQRRQSEQQQQQQVSSTSTGMLSPPQSLTGAATSSDPSKALGAAAANGMKGVPHTVAQFAANNAGNSSQLMTTAFPYMQSMPAAQVKPAEQKQPAGNDNLHACWQPEKK